MRESPTLENPRPVSPVLGRPRQRTRRSSMIKHITLGALLVLSSISFAADDVAVTRGAGDAGDAGGGSGVISVSVMSIEEHRTRLMTEDEQRSYMLQNS